MSRVKRVELAPGLRQFGNSRVAAKLDVVRTRSGEPSNYVLEVRQIPFPFCRQWAPTSTTFSILLPDKKLIRKPLRNTKKSFKMAITHILRHVYR